MQVKRVWCVSKYHLFTRETFPSTFVADKTKRKKNINERNWLLGSCTIQTSTGNLESGLGWEKTSSVYVQVLQLPCPLSQLYSPRQHTFSHTYSRVPFHLSSNTSKKDENKYKAKNNRQRGCRKCKHTAGSEESRAKGMGWTNCAVRENYVHDDGSRNIMLYFKKATMLWYSVTGTSGGRQIGDSVKQDEYSVTV